MSVQEKLICPNIHDLFEFAAKDAVNDFRNRLFVKDIPRPIKIYFQNCITQNMPHYYSNPIYNYDTGSGISGVNSYPNSYYSLLPFHIKNSTNLPNASQIFDLILARQAGQNSVTGSQLNVLFFTLINFILEDFLKTKPHAGGSEVADYVKGIFLTGVYGNTLERQQLLRSHVGGKLLTSMTEDDDEVALMWRDVPLENQPSSKLGPFVLGFDTLNRHWGHIFWASTFTILHNSLCDTILSEMKLNRLEFDDNEIFNRARMTLIIITYRFIFEESISNTLAQEPLAGKAMWRLNPLVDCSGEYHSSEKHLIEFNHIYRWHNMIPDKFFYSLLNQTITDIEFIESHNFTQYSLKEHYDAFYRTKAGAFTAHNIPEFLKTVTVMTIETERRIGMASFNDYIERYGLPRMKSFYELTQDASSASKLSELYESVDDVDLYVGILLRPAPVFSLEMLVMLASAVFTELYSDNHFCGIPQHYYTKEYLGSSLYDLAIENDRPFYKFCHNSMKLILQSTTP